MTSREETIKKIRQALKERSGKSWSVKGGHGSGWGWITITAPPRRLIDGWKLRYQEADELADLLGLAWVGQQGVLIPSSSDYYAEYVDRAEGRVPAVVGTPYWD